MAVYNLYLNNNHHTFDLYVTVDGHTAPLIIDNLPIKMVASISHDLELSSTDKLEYSLLRLLRLSDVTIVIENSRIQDTIMRKSVSAKAGFTLDSSVVSRTKKTTDLASDHTLLLTSSTIMGMIGKFRKLADMDAYALADFDNMTLEDVDYISDT